jgi:DHA2 family multidrug resistance protein
MFALVASTQTIDALPVAARSGIRDWSLILGISVAALAEAIAGTALSTGRLDMIGDTHATPDEFAWLDVAFTASKLIAFLLTPWLTARLSETTTVRVAAGLLALACGVAASTDNLDLLVATRIVQGLAGGILLVAGQAALFRSFPSGSQPIVQAVFAIGAVVAPACFVPLLSGWMIDSWSWNWIFLSGFAAAVAGLALIVAGGQLGDADVPAPKLDWAGLLSFGTAVIAVTYVLTQGSRWNWFEERHIALLAILGVIALFVFLLMQCGRRDGTLIDRSVFANQGFAFAFAVSFVAGFALSGSAYIIPSFAVSVLGMTATDAGLLLFPSGLLFVAMMFFVGWLIMARGLPPFATVPFGILAFMTAMWLLSGVNTESGIGDMGTAIHVRGAGLALLFLSLTLIALNGLPARTVVYGVALFDMGRLVGGQIGVAALQTLIDRQTRQNFTVLAANVNDGSPVVAARLGQLGNLVSAKGVEAGSVTKTALSLLARQVTTQAAVISFETAFLTIALLFVAAAPVLIIYKVALGRLAKPAETKA